MDQPLALWSKWQPIELRLLINNPWRSDHSGECYDDLSVQKATLSLLFSIKIITTGNWDLNFVSYLWKNIVSVDGKEILLKISSVRKARHTVQQWRRSWGVEEGNTAEYQRVDEGRNSTGQGGEHWRDYCLKNIDECCWLLVFFIIKRLWIISGALALGIPNQGRIREPTSKDSSVLSYQFKNIRIPWTDVKLENDVFFRR